MVLEMLNNSPMGNENFKNVKEKRNLVPKSADFCVQIALKLTYMNEYFQKNFPGLNIRASVLEERGGEREGGKEGEWRGRKGM
jgi:hypothetical protein